MDASLEKLILAVDGANTLEQLKNLDRDAAKALTPLYEGAFSAREATGFLTALSDAKILKTVRWLHENTGLALPEGAALLLLGSRGRREECPGTDLDTAIIYPDQFKASQKEELASFGMAFTEAAERAGFRPCPAKITVANPRWRKSEGEWQKSLERKVSSPTPQNLLDFGMLQDFRPILGDGILAGNLRKTLSAKAGANCIFLSLAAENVESFKPPLTFLNKLKPEIQKSGQPALDLKKSGLFAISAGISLMALAHGLAGGTTWEKIALLRDGKHLSAEISAELLEAFECLMCLRLKAALRKTLNDETPDDLLDPALLSREDEARLVRSLKTVKTLLSLLHRNFDTHRAR